MPNICNFNDFFQQRQDFTQALPVTTIKYAPDPLFQQVKCVFIVLWLFRLRHLNFIEMFKVGRETLPDLLQGLFSVQNFLPFLLRNWRNIILEIKKYDSRIEEIWFSLKELQFSWSHIGGAISNFILLIVIDAERENIKLIKLKYFILFGIFCIAAR